MNLDRVTITGPDDLTDTNRLADLSREFPFVEWGILVSATRLAGARFPSREWIGLLLATLPPSTRLSLHICGRWVRDLMVGGDMFFDEWFPLDRRVLERFQRVQLNFHAQRHVFRADEAADIVRLGFKGKQVIVQMDGTDNEAVLAALRFRGVDCVPLFDTSGGAGIIPASWPVPFVGVPYHGYAGGLGPETLEAALPCIEASADDRGGDANVWIDMETRVRSEDDVTFDLGKVRRCLEICAPHIRP